MSRSARAAALAALFLGGISSLHVVLNQGGFGTVLAKMRPGARTARGELVVAHLPVT